MGNVEVLLDVPHPGRSVEGGKARAGWRAVDRSEIVGRSEMALIRPILDFSVQDGISAEGARSTSPVPAAPPRLETPMGKRDPAVGTTYFVDADRLARS